jgi:hypothetical protein
MSRDGTVQVHLLAGGIYIASRADVRSHAGVLGKVRIHAAVAVALSAATFSVSGCTGRSDEDSRGNNSEHALHGNLLCGSAKEQQTGFSFRSEKPQFD